jgi:katanin p80 WD40 repeat-containing subunit B1
MIFLLLQVCADMASVLMEKSEAITLDLCTSILPVVTDLLESKSDRYFLLQSLQVIMIVSGILFK